MSQIEIPDVPPALEQQRDSAIAWLVLRRNRSLQQAALDVKARLKMQQAQGRADQVREEFLANQLSGMKTDLDPQLGLP